MESIASSVEKLAEILSRPSISDWMMVGITTIYVVETILICIFNRKSADAASKQLEETKAALEESRKQQKQNAGIQLYSIRKNFITAFSDKKYNEVFWDASILFSRETADQVQKTAFAYERFCRAREAIDSYSNRMKEDQPDMYTEYCQLSSCSAETASEALSELCRGYSPVLVDENGEKRLLLYSC